MSWDIVAAVSLGVWLYLLFGHGSFWRETVAPPAPEPPRWPSVVAVVPARNEAHLVGAAIRSLLEQDYPGEFSVVLVDDHSSDGTAEVARGAARSAGAAERLEIVAARTLPAGWTGKLWALAEGVAAVARRAAPPELVLFTDADIVHDRGNLRQLAARLATGFDLVSLMVKLRCETWAERAAIPAFVFFFQMLYPFAWVRDPRRRAAGAAGGCMLLRRAALERMGGLASIRGEIIDDCALARAVKRQGAVWLGLADKTRSLRPYPALGDIWRMVARTAYAQLRYSPAVLAATLAGLSAAFFAPVLAALFGGAAATLGIAAWAAMSLAYLPTLRFYERSPAWAPCLPAIAAFYMAVTVASARRHWLYKGSEWKGRIQRPSRA